MKVVCDRGVLMEALNLAGAVVLSRTPKPVLLCVKLTADNDSVQIASTDLEAALHLRIDQVEVLEPGEVLAPADKLSAIVKESIDPTITLEAEGEALDITGQDSHFKVYGQPVGDYPPVKTFDGECDFEISAGQMSDLITRTLFATARETSRYAINGVLLERDGKKVSMVATDGRRLALAKGSCTGAKGETASVIVPSKALNLLQRLIDDPDEMVKVKIADNQAVFAIERATLTTNLVEGNFPPYKDVIPKDQEFKATFNVDVLASGVRRAALLTNEESKGVAFNFAGEHLQLTSRAPEMGESEVTVPYAEYTGDSITIGFNPAFVLDGLKVVNSDTVTVEFKAGNKPGTIKSGNDFLYVVMPVSL